MSRKKTNNEVTDLVSQVEDKVTKEKPEEKQSRTLIPTGSTLLNLACSDNPWGGFGLGKVVNIIGDSSAGKTLLALTMLMEVCLDDKFKDYVLLYDDVERAIEFDFSKLFPGLEDRINLGIFSDTIQDFHTNVLNQTKIDVPFIYVLDSFDALTSDEEIEKSYKEAMARARTEEGAKAIAGSYKTEKAKLSGQILREIKGKLEQRNALLVVISQVRDNIGITFGSKKTRSGGHALKFYSTHEMWLAITSHIKNNKIETGVNVIAKVSKNKLTGKVRAVEFPIYYDYGVDDLGSCVDYLIETDHWKKNKQTLNAFEFELEGTKNKLLSLIEENNLENEVRKIVGQVWLEQEEAIKLGRKPRFN